MAQVSGGATMDNEKVDDLDVEPDAKRFSELAARLLAVPKAELDKEKQANKKQRIPKD